MRCTSQIGALLLSFVAFGCAGAASNEDVVSSSAASTTAPTRCPSAGDLFGAAVPLNVYSLGNIDYVCSDFEGAVGASGNIALNRVAVNKAFYRSERGSTGVMIPTRDALKYILESRNIIEGFTSPVDLADYAWVWNPSYTWVGVTYGRVWNGTRAYYEGASLSAGGTVTLAELTVFNPPFEAVYVEAGGAIDVFAPSDDRRQVTMGSSRANAATAVPHAQVRADLLAASARIASWGGAMVLLDARSNVALTTAAEVNVFSGTAATFHDASRIVVSGTSSSYVFINVTDAGAVDFTDFGDKIVLEGGIQPDAIVWNFANATRLQIAFGVIEGTVLAPRAATRFWEGRVDGSLYVGDLDGNVGGSGPAAHGALIACSGYSGGQVNYWRFKK